MSRNGAGAYQLPSASFIPLTPLVPTGVDSDFSDIAETLTDTIAADGQTTMTAPLIHENGVQTLPSITFTGDMTTGVYLIGSAMMGFAVSGSLIWSLSASGGLSVPIEQQANGAQNLPNGTTAQRPTATAGNWRWNSTTAELEVYDGANWVAVSGQSEISVDLWGNGSTLTSGVKAAVGPIPYGFKINQVELVSDVVGSVEVDIWANTYSAYPFTSGSSITASDVPTISSSNTYQDSALTGWTTSLSSGTVLMFNVVGSPVNIGNVNVTLRGKKT